MSNAANMENVVILQHVSPQNTQPIEFHKKQGNYIPADIPKHMMKFFQGEPEVLGVTQLFIGINHLFFGVILIIVCKMIYSQYILILVKTGVLFWSGIMYIISGSLSMAASYKPSLAKVKASLSLNIISCIAATVSVIIFAEFFSFISTTRIYYREIYDFCAYYKHSQICEGKFVPQTLYVAIGLTLSLLTALEFCVALSTSIFGCKTACRTSYTEMDVVIYHTTSEIDPKPASSSNGETQ